jgi:hypothetical protein
VSRSPIQRGPARVQIRPMDLSLGGGGATKRVFWTKKRTGRKFSLSYLRLKIVAKGGQELKDL